MNQSVSDGDHSAAITQFVQSPAASHVDVIALLTKLQAVIARRTMDEKGSGSVSQDVEPDAAADLLLESVILHVFDTDAMWFVLAFLLDPKTIASAPQRTTATLLTKLRLVAPIDRTVAVLRVLLEPRRRKAIGFFLHKQILRLLFECSETHDNARTLLLAEWQQRNQTDTIMPTDVHHDVITLAVNALFDPSRTKQDVAWRIVEDLVADGNTGDPDTLLLLFMPVWQPKPATNGLILGDLLRKAIWSDVLPPFRHVYLQMCNQPVLPFHVNMHRACERMVTLMNKLGSHASSHPSVRALAEVNQFLFSRALAGVPDDTAITRLHQLLAQATLHNEQVEDDDVQDWQLDMFPRIYAGLILQVLSHEFASTTTIDKQSCVDLCTHHPYATRLRETVGAFLSFLLHTPPAQAARRRRVSKALLALMDQVNQTSVPFPYNMTIRTTWAIQLVQEPFQKELDCLGHDSRQFAGLLPGIAKS
jgi:hypothetical protein